MWKLFRKKHSVQVQDETSSEEVWEHSMKATAAATKLDKGPGHVHDVRELLSQMGNEHVHAANRVDAARLRSSQTKAQEVARRMEGAKHVDIKQTLSTIPRHHTSDEWVKDAILSHTAAAA